METFPLDPAQRLLSVNDAARICGVTSITLRNWIRQGKVPVVRIDSALRIDRHDLEAVFQGAKQPWTPHKEFSASARKGHQRRQQQHHVSHAA